jgi:hypothetical protein
MSGPHRDLQVSNFAEKLKGSSCSSAPDAAHSKTIRIVDLFPSKQLVSRNTMQAGLVAIPHFWQALLTALCSPDSPENQLLTQYSLN